MCHTPPYGLRGVPFNSVQFLLFFTRRRFSSVQDFIGYYFISSIIIFKVQFSIGYYFVSSIILFKVKVQFSHHTTHLYLPYFHNTLLLVSRFECTSPWLF